MNVATPRLAIAALALAAAAAITLGPAIPAMLASPKHVAPAMPKARAEVSISQLSVGKDMRIAPAPATGKAIDTVVVQASR